MQFLILYHTMTSVYNVMSYLYRTMISDDNAMHYNIQQYDVRLQCNVLYYIIMQCQIKIQCLILTIQWCQLEKQCLKLYHIISDCNAMSYAIPYNCARLQCNGLYCLIQCQITMQCFILYYAMASYYNVISYTKQCNDTILHCNVLNYTIQ